MQYHKGVEFKKRTAKPLLLIVLVSAMSMNGCGENVIIKKTRSLMNTWVSVKAHDPFINQKRITKAIEDAFSGIEKIDTRMSTFRRDSQISLVNKLKANELIKVSPEIIRVINKANEIHDLSDGAFDITVFPLVKLWNSYGDRIPPRNEVAQTQALVGQEKLVIDKKYGYVGVSEEGMALDLSGIAKGFAVDEAINILKRQGVRNALIDAGGDIYCLGSGPDKRPWRVGLKHPRRDELIATLRLKDIAVATSGDYENFKIKDGKRFSHIIDPRTGYPIKDMPVSVTVLAADCVTADGLATAISVMGSEKGLELINSLDRVEGIVISEVGGSLKIDVSEGLEGLYEIETQ